MRRDTTPSGTRVATVAAALLWVACASGGTRAEAGTNGNALERAVRIEVRNDLTPSTSVTVLVDDPTESPRLLGSVTTDRAETFPLDTSSRRHGRGAGGAVIVYVDGRRTRPAARVVQVGGRRTTEAPGTCEGVRS